MAICDRCDKPIAGTPADAIHITSLGTHHEACMRAAWREHDAGNIERKAASRERRSVAMKARWEDGAMTKGRSR